MHIRSLFLATASAGLLAACTVGPVYHAPKPDIPKAWVAPQTGKTANVDIAHWWREFGDTTLNTLIDTALKENEDLSIAALRIEEAHQSRVVAEAALGPQVGAGLDIEEEHSSTTVTYPPGVGYSQYYRAGIDAAWDLDVFGGKKHALEAAKANVDIARENLHVVQVNLLSELVEDYAILRTSQSRLAIAERNIHDEQQSLSLTTRAYKAGLARSMDVERARAEVSTTEATLPGIRTTIAKMEHAISVLTGQYPGALKKLLDKPGTLKVPVLPKEVPSSLLQNRPDIRRAERGIARSVAEEGVATAARFPDFTIPLSVGPVISNLSDLFSYESLTWTAMLTGSQYIYDGGKRSAQEKAAQIRTREQRLAYVRTVKNAFRQVNDAWVDYAGQEQRYTSLSSAAKDERLALSQASQLYSRGLTPFLTVLDSERAVFQIEDNLARNDLARIQAVISLYKALGAGWVAEQQPGPAAPAKAEPQTAPLAAVEKPAK